MADAASLLSELTFGAFLQYSPSGSSEPSMRSRRWRDAVKADQPGQMRRLVEALAEREEADPLRGTLLGEEVALVPVPRSTPLRPGALWPSRRLCEELSRCGLGGEVVELLERVTPVQKSAFAARGHRPSAGDHFASLGVAARLTPAGRLLLVDDVVTKGATLLAAASRLRAAFPRVEIAGLAAIRTMGLQPEVERVVAPCVGKITLRRDGDVTRSP